MAANETIYQCRQHLPGTNPVRYGPVHYAKTEAEGMDWLSKNGGGLYRNDLHRFEFPVAAGRPVNKL